MRCPRRSSFTIVAYLRINTKLYILWIKLSDSYHIGFFYVSKGLHVYVCHDSRRLSLV